MWCRKKLNPSYKKPNKRRKSGAEKIKLIMKKSNGRRKCGAEKNKIYFEKIKY